MQIQKEKKLRMLEKLEGKAHEERLRKVHCFEQIEGGGIVKKVERLFTSPSIYIPYLFYAKTGLSRFLLTTVVLFWGRTIRIPLDDYDALILSMYGGLYGSELKLTKFLIKNLTKDDVFYDIGANRGFYTFLAADLCKEVHTFEAVPKLAHIVTVNTRPEDTIVVNPVALSDTDGMIDFYLMDSTMTNTVNFSVAELLSSHDHNVSKKVTVPSLTIDTYVSTHAKPTFLKIDIEGAEELAIKGGQSFFSSHSPVIAMEVWGKGNKWELSMNAAERLRAMGYKSYRMDNGGDIYEIKGDLSTEVSSIGGDNFIFKK